MTSPSNERNGLPGPVAGLTSAVTQVREDGPATDNRLLALQVLEALWDEGYVIIHAKKHLISRALGLLAAITVGFTIRSLFYAHNTPPLIPISGWFIGLATGVLAVQLYYTRPQAERKRTPPAPPAEELARTD